MCDIEVERNLDEEIKASGYLKQGLSKKEIEDIVDLNLHEDVKDKNLEEESEEDSDEESEKETEEKSEEESEEEHENPKAEDVQNTVLVDQQAENRKNSGSEEKNEFSDGEKDVVEQVDNKFKLTITEDIKRKVKKQMQKQGKQRYTKNKSKGQFSIKEI